MKYYGKKRVGRKPVRRTKTTKKPARKVSTAVKSYVRRAISSNLENKVFIAYTANTNINTTGPSQAPTASQLLPYPAQGVGHSQRVGNEILVKRAYITGRINILPYNSLTNPLSTPILVKMWLVSNKQANNFSPTSTTAYNNFFEVMNGSIGFQANTLDLFLTPNKDAWTVHASKTMHLGATYASSSGQVGTSGYFDNSKMSLPFYFSYAKHIKHLKFDDTTLLPTNKNLYLVYQAVNADGSNSLNETLCEVHYSIRVEYEDA